MCAWVYVLRSASGRYYYGSTNDLERRLAEHQRGKTATTAKDGPWSLVGTASFACLTEAREQERLFKRWKKPSREWHGWKATVEGAASCRGR